MKHRAGEVAQRLREPAFQAEDLGSGLSASTQTRRRKGIQRPVLTSVPGTHAGHTHTQVCIQATHIYEIKMSNFKNPVKQNLGNNFKKKSVKKNLGRFIIYGKI